MSSESVKNENFSFLKVNNSFGKKDKAVRPVQIQEGTFFRRTLTLPFYQMTSFVSAFCSLLAFASDAPFQIASGVGLTNLKITV